MNDSSRHSMDEGAGRRSFESEEVNPGMPHRNMAAADQPPPRPPRHHMRGVDMQQHNIDMQNRMRHSGDRTKESSGKMNERMNETGDDMGQSIKEGWHGMHQAGEDVRHWFNNSADKLGEKITSKEHTTNTNREMKTMASEADRDQARHMMDGKERIDINM